MGTGLSIGWIGVSAVEVAKERAKSNGENHIGSSDCRSVLMFKGINLDSSAPRNHVFLFISRSVGMAMIGAQRGSKQKSLAD